MSILLERKAIEGCCRGLGLLEVVAFCDVPEFRVYDMKCDSFDFASHNSS